MEQKNYLLNNIVIDTLLKNGFEAYFVGGAVRDYLLKRSINDIDITTSATPEKIKNLFNKTLDTGIKHGTITVIENNKNYEVTTFRKEKKYINYRHPNKVVFVKKVKQDVKRRDFTINAMLMKSDFNIIDYFKGIKHCNEKIIKTVGNPNKRFKEDALRMLRAIRFSSQLGFSIHKNTWIAIKKYEYLLKYISKERITQEFIKTIKGEYISNINQLKVFPIFNKLYFDKIVEDKDLVLLLASLINTKENLNLLDFLTIDKNTKNSIRYIINNMNFKDIEDKVALKKLINEIGIVNCEKLLILIKADLDVFSEIIINQEPIFLSDLKITGSDIIIHGISTEGKQIGEILDLLLIEVWKYPKKNELHELIKLCHVL